MVWEDGGGNPASYPIEGGLLRVGVDLFLYTGELGIQAPGPFPLGQGAHM